MYTLIVDGAVDDTFNTFYEMMEAAKKLKERYPSARFQYVEDVPLKKRELELRSAIADAIRRGQLPNGYELQESDIGRLLCPLWGFGQVLPFDVGKKCFVRSGLFEMENSQQRDKRKGGKEP